MSFENSIEDYLSLFNLMVIPEVVVLVAENMQKIAEDIY